MGLAVNTRLDESGGRTAASALRGPLEVQRLYQPDATRPARLHNLPRQLGQLRTALMVPCTVRGKGRALAAAIRYTNWRRKLTGGHAPATVHRASE